ncbi:MULTISPECIES: phenylalanine--tRNA ligase subunit alpha [Dyadobacter]|uniref:Phenylalanine--tRNA ligase alpha subunit n=1 Tax=Dyadobacter chenhuakuii TaxID=2909339 RepID=A0ABY4XFS5_9BACT|nr:MULTISPECIES: phenylalanine--tRNA ligase subunit alpha [Dyadobacter]MCF2491976.1 phenylalanine--tRNA ligase subunit alpha [Dyadobacter chenhuakuii]MCF2516613.1 phenylalanine--tRNA ligase subunit alpha [Dyadobacter sp. CY351]USJ28863.1 phenylalanine--tRNA ligase subunit alpha [Dyadobacter chenhuakuii]
MVTERVKELISEIEQATVNSKDQLEAFRLRYISKKGVVSELFDGLKNIPQEDRRAVGQELNTLKNLAQDRFQEFNAAIENAVDTNPEMVFDLTLPVVPNQQGSLHPLTIVRRRIIEIFERMGFNVSYGPEIEKDWYNFSALNFADNHPAREMQDTFFISKSQGEVKDDVLLRTHTSNVQVRLMERQKPPIRSIMPGRVFRNEAISARAHCVFHQVEGLYVDRNVSFKDLKDTLYHFAKEMFGKESKIRLRPSYFPFTEPSAEIDVTCFICKGKGCNICKYSGWVEIAGSGMVDPNVLTNCGIDSEEYTGFAFGMGIERITMLRYGINDLRLFTENDVRFLRQFEGA